MYVSVMVIHNTSTVGNANISATLYNFHGIKNK